MRSRRDSSNSEPDGTSPGAAAAHSERPLRAAGVAARLEKATEGTGSMANLPGLAAEVTATATDLCVSRQSSPPRCARSARVRPHAHVYGRGRCRGAVWLPPRLSDPAPESPSTDPTPLDSLA